MRHRSFQASFSVTMFGIILATVTPARAISVSVKPQTVNGGDEVKATIDVGGAVGVESDLSGTSTSPSVGSDGTVTVGPAKQPGLYFVRLVVGKEDALLAVLVTDAGEGKFTAESVQLSAQQPAGKPPEVAPALLTKFADAVAKDEYAAAKRAAKKAATTFVSQNAAKLTGTITICILPVPGAQAVCIARIGDHIVDLGFDFTNALIDEAPGLTAAERQKLRALVQAGRTVVDLTRLVRADRGIERILEATSTGADLTSFVVKNQGGDDVAVSVISSNAVGLINKTAVTIKLVTK